MYMHMIYTNKKDITKDYFVVLMNMSEFYL